MHYALCIMHCQKDYALIGKTPKIKKVADTHVQATLADETFNYSFIASFILSYFLFRNQMMPWPIMASATFMNPAMLAPFM